MHRMSKSEREERLPAWFVGFLLAIALFGFALLVMSTLGYGDDPVVDPNAVDALRLLIRL